MILNKFRNNKKKKLDISYINFITLCVYIRINNTCVLLAYFQRLFF